MRQRRRPVLALAAAAIAGVGGAVLVTAGGAAAATGCAVDHAVTSQWTGGFVATVTVRNLGDAVSSWRLTWTYGGGQRVTAGWNATLNQSGTQVTAVNAGHNGALATNATATFGLQGTSAAAAAPPTGFALNGVACTGVPVSPAPGTVRPPTPSARPTPAGTCPAAGRITYTLRRVAAPTAAQQAAYARITTAMDQALAVYNCHTDIAKALTVTYDPAVPTADANYNGAIRFGATSSMQQATAMHEIGHTLGVGTVAAWSARLSGGAWTGSNANAALRAITGDPSATIRGDASHFWPYGLNYPSEVRSPADLVHHTRIVVALRRDMGL
ncbi:MAG TPA: cellulose-binding domain-containing protein [Pilimelia sp.]|nr:cellulose-binding domain-containing protein [Pilimelia sp.]